MLTLKERVFVFWWCTCLAHAHFGGGFCAIGRQCKIKIKLKKTIGEDDIESVVKAIEEEERKRQEVKEVNLGETGPTHRSNLSLVVHPENPELVLFGGEFFNGQKTELNNELLHYDIKRKSWKQVKSPAGPAPRCSHQGKY